MQTNSHAQTNEHGLVDLGAHRRESGNVSPLQQEVLDEYARLARNMERVSGFSDICILSLALPGTAVIVFSFRSNLSACSTVCDSFCQEDVNAFI